jgi:hypothetical protein
MKWGANVLIVEIKALKRLNALNVAAQRQALHNTLEKLLKGSETESLFFCRVNQCASTPKFLHAGYGGLGMAFQKKTQGWSFLWLPSKAEDASCLV